jgi:GT2 family glycosyltransferase
VTVPDAIAVVVVCHDSAGDLPGTLGALLPQLRAGDELVLVDNRSRDGTADVARRLAPGATVLAPDANLGFAGGANAGVAASSAPLVLLLNPDATMGPGALDALRAVASAEPGWGAWQALVTLPGGAVVNSAGNPVHFLGFAWAGDHGRPVAAEDGRRTVPTVSGAALCARRTAWAAAQGFDARYFLYGEDLDLSLRLRLAGWELGLEPAARVEHDYAFVKGDYKWFHLERNRWWTVLAVYPAPLLALLAPALLAFELALLPAAAAGGWLRPKRAAIGAGLRSLGAVRARRRAVQATRAITPRAFAAQLTPRLDSEFLGAAGRSRAAALVLSAYWALVRALLP